MLKVNALYGFGVGGGGSWVTAFSASIGSGGAQSFNTENYRMQVKGSDFTQSGGTQIRLTVYSHPTNTLVVTAMTVGQCAATYSATDPDFNAAPTPVTFNAALGAAPWTFTAGGGPWISDPIAFGLTAGIISNGLCIAIKFNNGSNLQVANGTGGTGVNAGYKTVADETGTANVSSYVSSTDNYKQVMVGKVEVFIPS